VTIPPLCHAAVEGSEGVRDEETSHLARHDGCERRRSLREKGFVNGCLTELNNLHWCRSLLYERV
jgi:hypothetical protein